MTIMTMVQAINAALRQEMERDESVIVLGEDVGVDGGVFRVTDGLIKDFPDRIIDTPLAELGIIGTSIGLALGGMKPVAEIQFDGFVYSGLDQMISHMSRIRNRSRGRYKCPMVVRFPYGGGIKALEHHSEAMEALFAHIPGLKVVIPSTPYDAKGLLASAIRDPDPVIFMEPKRVYRAIKEDVPEEEYTIEIGKANIHKEGSDVTLIAWGSAVKMSLDVLDKIGDISVELIDLRTISPMDTETILNSVRKTGRVVIAHEEPQSFGTGAEIMARITERELLSLKAPIKRVTGYDVPTPYPKLENYYLPNVSRVTKAIQEVMKF